MHPRDLAVASVALSLELAQGLCEGSAGAAGTRPPRSGNGPHIPSSVDCNVWKREEDVALSTCGLHDVQEVVSQ
jgi:hypothetical protein